MLKGGFYKIRLGNNTEVLAKLCGKMRRHHIKIVVADKVLVELSPYDLGRGRITYRL
ncbi:translation initiation factor IF-1 [Chloroflexota bacterium]